MAVSAVATAYKSFLIKRYVSYFIKRNKIGLILIKVKRLDAFEIQKVSSFNKYKVIGKMEDI